MNVPFVEHGIEPFDFLDERVVSKFFGKDPDNIWRFIVGESDCHECKESFGFKHPGNWLRAVAALANNRGGYVLFGVKDKIRDGAADVSDSYRVVGLANSEFENADPADFSKKIKATFDPTPRVRSKVMTLGEAKLGVLHVEQHSSRPVIATKSEHKISEGDIFFRYSGQSSKIKYSDLRAVLDERDRQARSEIMPMIEKLLQLGPQNSMIADLKKGKLEGEKSSIIIGEDLIEKIRFIKEGEFREKDGSTTLRLVGDVKSVSSEKEAEIHREIVTPNDLVSDFLKQNTPAEPREYIKCAVQLGNGAWLPIHYFANKADLSTDELVELIKGYECSSSFKKNLYQ